MFQCDLTADDLLGHVPPESVDAVLLVFVLSAVHPEKMHLVLQNLYKVSDRGPALEGCTSRPLADPPSEACGVGVSPVSLAGLYGQCVEGGVLWYEASTPDPDLCSARAVLQLHACVEPCCQARGRMGQWSAVLVSARIRNLASSPSPRKW